MYVWTPDQLEPILKVRERRAKKSAGSDVTSSYLVSAVLERGERAGREKGPGSTLNPTRQAVLPANATHSKPACTFLQSPSSARLIRLHAIGFHFRLVWRCVYKKIKLYCEEAVYSKKNNTEQWAMNWICIMYIGFLLQKIDTIICN